MPRSVPPGVPNAATSLPTVRSFVRPHDQSGTPPVVTGDAALAGLSALVAVAMLVIPATATGAGTSNLAGAAIVQEAGAATLAGSSNLAAAGLVQVRASATTPGSSALAGSASLIVPAVAASPGSSSLTGVAGGAAAEDGSPGGHPPFAILHSPGLRLLTGEAALEGRSDLTAEGEVLRVARAAAKRKAPAVARGRAKVVVRLAAAELVGGSGLVAAGHGITSAPRAALAGSAGLTVAGETIRSTTVDQDEDEELLLLLGVF